MPWAISFPHYSDLRTETASPPYDHQHRLGLLHGILVAPDDRQRPVVAKILDEQGPAARAGLRAGDRITRINGQDVNTIQEAMAVLAGTGPDVSLRTSSGRTSVWSVGDLPSHSLPVSPTQIYASLNAALIFLFLFAYYPFRRRDGEVIALLLSIYPVTRFLLEIIRTDENAVLGTPMTISQNASLLLFAAVIGLWVYVLRRPPGLALPPTPATS
jgi:phosphatidylglycerol:prolipoprotein diacylglycerol transferase